MAILTVPLLMAMAPYAVAVLVGVLLHYVLTTRRSSGQAAGETRRVEGSESLNEYVFLDKSGKGTEDYIETPSGPEEDHEANAEHIPFTIARYSSEEMINRSFQFYQEMNKRRSVRFFSDQPVPIEVVQNIVRTAGTAPSGAHTEPWTYVVISNKEMKSKIREIIEDEEEINYAKRMGPTWVNDLKAVGTTWEKPYLETVPYIVIVFKQTYGLTPSGERKNHYYSELSVAISVGLFMAAVQNAGLVTLTSTPLNAGPRLRALLNRPVNEKVILLLPLGYPSADCTVPNFKRKPLEDVMVHF